MQFDDKKPSTRQARYMREVNLDVIESRGSLEHSTVMNMPMK